MISFESASAAAIALVVLSGCCVLVRFFSRVALVKHVGPDDYLIALAWGASLALAVVLRQCESQDLSNRATSAHFESQVYTMAQWMASLR